MTLQIKTPYGGATEARVDELERQLGIGLPEPYRTFLRTVGGAKVAGSDVPGTDDGYLSKLYDVDALIHWHVTTGRDHGFIAYVPHEYVMIGGGSGGAPCLRTAGGDEGSVWWADFEKAGGFEVEEPHEEIMIRLADDFDGFLELFD